MAESASLSAGELDQPGLEAWAARLASALQPPLSVGLSGPLGAGKSTFARALLRALGVPGRIKSPSYTLLEPYSLPTLELWHLDLYRLAKAAELDALGLREQESALRVLLIEWPERAPGALPLDATLAFDHVAGRAELRRVEVHAHSPRGRRWLAAAELSKT